MIVNVIPMNLRAASIKMYSSKFVLKFYIINSVTTAGLLKTIKINEIYKMILVVNR